MRQKLSLLLLLVLVSISFAQPPRRGSLIEDRAAKKLIAAGDARADVEEYKKAVEVWQSVLERYPASRFRFIAHLRLGNYYLDRERAFERARGHFKAVASEENRDVEQRAEGMLKLGACFYHDRKYGKCFQVMREIIKEFPISPQVNEAYYYIGLGHFQSGHYSRAISALEKVGTTLSKSEGDTEEKLEAGKRLFVKIEDADLAVLAADGMIEVLCKTSGGDEEKVKCFPVGRNARLALGSVPTRLGTPAKADGVLQVKGGDKVIVTYTDQHTAEKELNRPVVRQVAVVGNGHAQITDGAFAESLRGVVLGKSVNVQISDADGDISDTSDSIKAAILVYRLKSEEELEAEEAKAAAARDADEDTDEKPEIDPYKVIDRVEFTLKEAVVEQAKVALPKSNLSPGESPLGQPPAGSAVDATDAADNNDNGSAVEAVEKSAEDAAKDSISQRGLSGNDTITKNGPSGT